MKAQQINETVMTVIRDSLYTNEELVNGEEPPEDAVLVKGLTATFGFHPERLESHREEIAEVLKQFPDGYNLKKGGGWSFLNLCMTKDNEQWGEHKDMEALCVIAIGLKLAQWTMPHSMWSVLPGGMPYISFNIKEKEDVDTVLGHA